MLSAGTRGAIGIDPDIVRLDLDIIVLCKLRHHLTGDKRCLSLALRIKRADPDKAVYAVLRAKEAVGIGSVDLEVHGFDAGFIAVHQVHDIHGKALLICPSGIHTEQHGAPVTGLGAAGTRIQGDNGIVLIIGACQQRGQADFLQMIFKIIQLIPDILYR